MEYRSMQQNQDQIRHGGYGVMTAPSSGNSEPPEFLTVAEAATLLRMPEATVRRMLKSGRLPGIYGGTRGGWRIRRADLLTWHTNAPRPKPASDDNAR